jgi:hypothetical protein
LTSTTFQLAQLIALPNPTLMMMSPPTLPNPVQLPSILMTKMKEITVGFDFQPKNSEAARKVAIEGFAPHPTERRKEKSFWQKSKERKHDDQLATILYV